MKFVLLAAALVLSLSAQAQRGHGGGGGMGGGGHMGGGHAGGGFGGGHGGGFGGGHGGGFGGGHGGGHGGGFHRGGGSWTGGGVWRSYPGSVGYGSCGWDGYYCNDSYVGGSVACAPEQVEGNVAKTEKTLNALAATSSFATATLFKTELAQVSKISNAGEKAQAMLKLAGIDSEDKAAVANFIGSRDAKGAWITDLQRNADLTSAQAEVVASSLQSALRGNLQ